MNTTILVYGQAPEQILQCRVILVSRVRLVSAGSRGCWGPAVHARQVPEEGRLYAASLQRCWSQ